LDPGTGLPRQGELRLLIWTTFLLAFTALLPIINPLGSALVFLGLTGPLPAPVYRSLARKIAINNIVFLAIFELLGSAILRFFSLSLPIIQVSGGLIIASLGWAVLNQKDAQASAQSKQDEADACQDAATRDLEQKLFYPFTFPVTSGPGTLVVTLTLSAHASHPELVNNVLSHLGLFLAIVVISIICYFCYAYAPRITQAIPQSTVHGILRVMGFIVVSIGVQIAWNGLSTLIVQLPRR
jgi:multiple antibiotic resistance protein